MEQLPGTLNAGSIITATDPNGIILGQFTITNNGRYGFLTCLADDPATPEDEGAIEGDTITFYLNGTKQQNKATWKSEDTIRVDLGIKADIIYVDGVNGDNNNDGLTRDRAKRTIRAGIAQAEAGYVVEVYPAVYNESWINLKGGLILYGQDPKTTIIDGSGLGGAVVHIEPGWGEYLFNSAEAVISGFTIMGSAQRYEGIRISHCSPVIKNCIIKNNYHGIFNYGDASPKIVNNVIASNTYAGIRTSTFEGASSDIIKNNIIVQNNIGIWAEGGSSPMLSYNDVWSNNSNYSGVTPAASDISADPLFVEVANNDYHLGSGSPCIDAGVPDSIYNDLDGSRNDMGSSGGPGITDEIDNIGNLVNPEINLIEPENNTLIESDTVTLSGTIRGDYVIAKGVVYDEAGNEVTEVKLRPDKLGGSSFSEEVGLSSGENRIVITASNRQGEVEEVRIIKVNRAPVLGPIGDKSLPEGKLLEFTVTATDPDQDNLTYSISNLPQGASFNNSTFSWTPTYEQAGTYQLIFTVSDGELTDQETVSIEVVDVPQYLASISGRVLEVSSGTRTKPIAKAKVTLVGLRQSRQVTTDNQGRYKIQNLPKGRYRLTASKQGYRTQSRYLKLNRNQQLMNINFYLKPTSPAKSPDYIKRRFPGGQR